MMIEKIYLKNFRNYQELSMCPSKGVNLIYGKNGAGKTNIIESIHYCSYILSVHTELTKTNLFVFINYISI